MKNEKIYSMSFARIYPLLVAKAERKGRTQTEVDEIITWLTGYSQSEIKKAADNQIRYLDKLVDELVKGKSMEKIKRSE